MRLPHDDRIGDVLHLQQHALHLRRVDFLAADVDDLGLAAQDADVLAINLDHVIGVEPTLFVEWIRCIEIA